MKETRSMKEIEIILKTEMEALELVNLLVKYPCDVDMVSGRYAIDAKSILGVLGLGLGKKVKLVIHADDAKELLQQLSPYLCKA